MNMLIRHIYFLKTQPESKLSPVSHDPPITVSREGEVEGNSTHEDEMD